MGTAERPSLGRGQGTETEGSGNFLGRGDSEDKGPEVGGEIGEAIPGLLQGPYYRDPGGRQRGQWASGQTTLCCRPWRGVWLSLEWAEKPRRAVKRVVMGVLSPHGRCHAEEIAGQGPAGS